MAEAEPPPARQPLKLEPPTRKMSPVALHAWREGRTKERAVAAKGPRWDRRRVGGALFVAFIAFVALSIVTVLVLPGCIRRHAIAAASRHGIALTVEGVHVSPGRYVLRGVAMSSLELPGLSLRAAEIEVELSGIEPARVTLRNGDIAATGAYDAVLASIARFHAAHAKGDANAPAWALESMRLAWTDQASAARRLDALELRAEVVPRTGEAHVQSPHVTIETTRGALGPWRFNYDREARTVRARVGFDPQLGDGPSVLVIADDARVTSVELNVGRTTLAALGMPAATIGLAGASDATPVEATARYTWRSPGRAEARATLAIFGLRITRAMPLDAKLDLEATGDPAFGMAVKRGELTLGPLKGQVTGQLRAEGGARLELAFATSTVPCSAFLLTPTASAAGAKPWNEIGDQLKQLAHALGLAKVTGDYKADGSLVLDASDPSKSGATFKAQSTCEAELFGQ